MISSGKSKMDIAGCFVRFDSRASVGRCVSIFNTSVVFTRQAIGSEAMRCEVMRSDAKCLEYLFILD